MTAVDKVIDLARSQVGYKETPVNITKYAADFDSLYPTFYNTKKQGAEWCDIFFDWLYVKSFGENTAREMLYQPLKSAGAGCYYSAGYYKMNNRFYRSPERGDQIFFYVGGQINHTGIVVNVTSDKVTTIEGNAGNAVRENVYNLFDSKIAGYGRPNWLLVDDKPKGETVMIEMPVLKQGAKCPEVGTLQIMLNAFGYKGKNNKSTLKVDCDYGSNTAYAVHNLQCDMKNKGLIQNVDDTVGQKTWTYLLKSY